MSRTTLEIFQECQAQDGLPLLATHRVVCPRCDGNGTHVNPAIDGNGIPAEEFMGPDWDAESREMYLSGGYDVTCERCHGARVVDEVDRDRSDPQTLAEYDAWEDSARETEAIYAMERRMGA